MKSKYFLIILIISGCTSYESLKLIDSEFENSNKAESKYVGMVGVPSKKFKKFTFLWNKLNEKEKVELSKKGNLISKFYASEKIINERSDKIMEIFKHNLEDHRMVNYLKADVQKPTEISIEMLARVNELITIKSRDSLSIAEKVKGFTEIKKAFKRTKIERPGYLEFITQENDYNKEIDSWTLGGLTELRGFMIAEIKENKNSSKNILKFIEY